MKTLLKRLLPPNTLRRKVVRAGARKLGLIAPAFIDGRYQEWIASTEALHWTPPRELAYQPLISIIVPVFNVPDNYLRQMVFSVVGQTYGNWELLLINASSDPKCRDYTKRCTQIDNRIRIVELVENLGIGENTNKGIAASKGEYIVLLDHDDTLAVQALYEVACVLQAAARPGLVYSDEDKLTATSDYRYDPHLKSDWSLHLFRTVNYLNHLTVIEKKLVDKVGAYRKGFDGAQDYDFYLRLIDEHPVIIHIAKVLYHWRAAPNSTASDFSSKKKILDAGIRALGDHLARNELVGTVDSLEKQPGYYKIQYQRDTKRPLAVVVLPGKAANQYAEYVRKLTRLLPATGCEVFVSNLQANQKFIAAQEGLVQNIETADKKEFLQAVLATSKAHSFVVLDAAIMWDDNTWMEELAGHVEQCADVAAVAPLVVDHLGKSIVDAGFVRQDDTLVPLFLGYPVGAHTFFGSTVWTRSVDAVSGRVAVLSRQAMEAYLVAADGLFPNACKLMQAAGKEIILRPQASLYYHGDMNEQAVSAPRFSPVLGVSHYEFGFPQTTRFNPSGDDNA